MKIFKYLFMSLILCFILNSAGFCQMFSFEKTKSSRLVVFPAGTFFKGVLQNDLSSSKSKIGDKVYLLIPFDVKIGKVTCIPKKSMIIGQVIQVQKAKQGKNGFIQTKFEYIKFPDGWGTQLSARLWSSDGKGIIGGETTKRTAYRKMPHYIDNMGAVVQLIESGPRSMGQEKNISAGSEFVIVLDTDLEIAPNVDL